MGQKVSPQDAADMLGVSMRTVRRFIATGELRAYRVGSTPLLRIDTDDIEEMLTLAVPEPVSPALQRQPVPERQRQPEPRRAARSR